jgi:hypothetical protein
MFCDEHFIGGLSTMCSKNESNIQMSRKSRRYALDLCDVALALGFV